MTALTDNTIRLSREPNEDMREKLADIFEQQPEAGPGCIEMLLKTEERDLIVAALRSTAGASNDLASTGQAATPATLTAAGRCGGKKTGHQYEMLAVELDRLVAEKLASEYVLYRLADAANAIRALSTVQAPAGNEVERLSEELGEAMFQRDQLLPALRSARCPAGGWNGMPKEIVTATVADCLKHGTCGCDLGDAVKCCTHTGGE